MGCTRSQTAAPAGMPRITWGSLRPNVRSASRRPRSSTLGQVRGTPAAIVIIIRTRRAGKSISLTWGICTRRAGKLYRVRSRLYRSQILQVNTSTRWKYNLFEKKIEKKEFVGKLSPRSTQCTPLHRYRSLISIFSLKLLTC